MKKFLICLLVLSLFSGMAFAATAVKASAPAIKAETKLDITTVTKERSTADYPGVLVPGSLIGTSVFVSDYANFPNVALFEYVNSKRFGLVSLSTEYGQIGLSISPAPYSSLWAVNPIIGYDPITHDPITLDPIMLDPIMLDNVVGIQYGNKISGMPVGVSLLYGNNRSDDQIVSVGNNNWWEWDVTSSFVQYLSLRGGINISSMDLSLGAAFVNSSSEYDSWDDSDTWARWEQYDDSKLKADAALRMDLGDNFTGYAALAWTTGTENYRYKSGDFLGVEDYLDEIYNSKLSFEALVGKDIKAGESLIIRIATGVTADGDTSAKERHTDYRDPTENDVGYFSQYNESVFEIPLNVAVEGKLNDTWSFNTGVHAVLLSLRGKKDATNTDQYLEKIRESEKWNYAEVQPSLDYEIGLTGVIGDLKLDMFLNPGIFITGPYFLGGTGAGTLNAGIAFSYLW